MYIIVKDFKVFINKQSQYMKTQVLPRNECKSYVKEVLESETIEDGDLFIVGVTKAKKHNGEHQMILEIVQKKNIISEKSTALSVLKVEDDRFNKNARDYKVWLKITKKGFDSVFTSLVNHSNPDRKLTGDELHGKTASLKPKEVLLVLSKIKSVTIEGEEVRPTINVKQYSSEFGLAKQIQIILDIEPDDRSEQQDLVLETLSMKTAEGEPFVDRYGNQVYEVNEFSFGEDENTIISKMPISKYLNSSSYIENTYSHKKLTEICLSISKIETIVWTSELIEKYEDKWNWNQLSKNASIPWTLKLINKYADKLTCSESIWNRLKPYIDEELIEDVFSEINKS